MKKIVQSMFTLLLVVSLMIPSAFGNVYAEDVDEQVETNVSTDGFDVLGKIVSYEENQNEVIFTHDDGNKSMIRFIDNNIFRYYVDISDEEFLDFATPRDKSHEATITTTKDENFISENKPNFILKDNNDEYVLTTDQVEIIIGKDSPTMKVYKPDGTLVLEEVAPIMTKGNKTVQSLKEFENEYFYGGGTQNGRFSHKGEIIKVINSNNWVDGGVASPNPFYWSTKGYGVVRNTFSQGEYDFGSTVDGVVSNEHNESRFDAYIFVGDSPKSLLNSYTDITGKPAQQPDYAFYLAHLNCYNRDVWKEISGTNGKLIDGKYYSERNPGTGGVQEGEIQESLMPKGDNDVFTAKRQIEIQNEYDLPLGSFYPNDGYGCGYGQTDSLDGDIQELKAFVDFAKSNGVETGLWTQANLWPKDADNPQKGERDIRKEVEDAGVRAVKTDVAWVGAGYSMALNGVMRAYDAITELGESKAMIVSLDGWAGTQRYAGIWSGDQSGGNWEYIRFHIPTYIGTGLSGMPTVGSDLDGIFGGKNSIVQTRDFQWKAFTPHMLDMDGWGSSQKNPWEFGEDNLSINRAYLKLKAQLMPYISTISKEATDTGMPMVRAMMLEYPDTYTLSKNTQYQYMWGDSFLVAPIYQETKMDAEGNDIRNGIYLPDEEQIWIDYFTGEQYRGGRILNDYDAPIWKTPIFVKNGSIIPMYSENNNPSPKSETNKNGLDKSERIVEFYPNNETIYELYEDDGISYDVQSTNTTIKSNVVNDTLNIEINPTVGTYPNMITDRSTELIVNVSANPTKVLGNVKGEEVEFTRVSTLEEYESATGNVFFYNENPTSFINEYASEDSDLKDVEINVRPKLYIKSTEKININDHKFAVTVEGFKNDIIVDPNEENDLIQVPENLSVVEDSITPYEFEVAWNKVDSAKTYDLLIDGVVYSNLKSLTYKHEDLKFDTDYKVQVRTVNDLGFSKWSDEITVRTALDPYRNVPEKIDAIWTGGPGYASTKPQDAVDNDNVTHFHSGTSGDAYNNTFTLDMNKMYNIEKFEYIPRDDGGNGTIQKVNIDYSIDGQTWKKAINIGEDTDAWVRDGKAKYIDFSEPINARYIRLTVKQSVGGFFTAHELRPYAVDGDKGKIVGDWNNSGAIDEGDLTFFDNYAGLRKGEDSSFDGYVEASDINFDGVIDAYDISYVARLLNKPVKPQNKEVKGSMFVVPSKEYAEAGEEVTYTVYGLGMENVYALNIEFPYNLSEYTHVENNQSVLTQFMNSFSYNRTHTSGRVANYLIYTNVGNEKLINGTGVIGSFTMKKVTAGKTDLVPFKGNFVGDNNNVIDALVDVEEPTLPETSKTITLEDIKSLTFTNEFLAEADGSQLFQQENFAELLFDQDKSTKLAEFKWHLPPADLAKEVKLPTTFNIELKKDEPVKNINVYNRAKGANGAITSVEAYAYDGEVKHDLGKIDDHQNVFTWNLDDIDSVDRIEINVLTSSGKASGSVSGSEENRMLSIYEIEILTDSYVDVESIKFNEQTPTEISLDSFTEVIADVNPKSASNPFYNIESSDNDVLRITTITTDNGFKHYATGIKPGVVTLTATSRGNNTITDTIEVTVTDSFDTTLLEKAIAEAEDKVERLYTEESFEQLSIALNKALTVVNNPISSSEIDKATMDLNSALRNLVLKGSNEDQEDSEYLIDNEQVEVSSYTNYADGDKPEHTLDGIEETIWHTKYQAQDKLPVEIVYELDQAYMLEQFDFLASTRGKNGDITRYRLEVSIDGTEFEPIVEITLDHDENGLYNRTSYKKAKFDRTEAKYIKLIALNSLGAQTSANDKYASISEVKIYGPSVEQLKAQSINFKESEVIMVVNDQLQLEYEVLPTNAVVDLVWTATDDSIVRLENNKVTALKAGKTTVTVLDNKSNLSATVDVIVEKATIDKLRDLVFTVDSKLEDEDFTTNLHEDLFSAVSNANNSAKDLIKKYDEDSNTVDEHEINDAYAALSESFNNLDYKQLVNELVELMNLDLTKYDVSTIDAFSLLQDEAKVLEADLITNLVNIDDMVKRMNKEKVNLIVLDFTVLDNLIKEIESLDLDKYMSSSKELLSNKLDDANNVMLNATTNKEINDMYTELENTYKNAELKMTSTQENSIKEYANMLENLDLSKYKESTQKLIEEKIVEINEFLATERSLSEAATFITSLKDFDTIVNNPDNESEKVDKSKLESIIKEAEKLDESKYTKDSWKALNTNLIVAKKVYADIDAKQSDVNFAEKQLQAAIESLVLVTDESNVIKGFKGLPKVVRVGDKFTLYPESSNGKWEYDKEFFVATFDTNATFIALKTGKTEIKYVGEDGVIQIAEVEILAAKPDVPSTEAYNNYANIYMLIAMLFVSSLYISRRLYVRKK